MTSRRNGPALSFQAVASSDQLGENAHPYQSEQFSWKEEAGDEDWLRPDGRQTRSDQGMSLV